MAEAKDVFESVLETQEDATKQKLSALQEKIESHISSTPFEKLGNSVTGQASGSSLFDMKELIAAAYAERVSKDIILDHVAGAKNEQLSFLGKILQYGGDKIADAILKQNNSYDSVLTNMKEIAIQQFKDELDDLKKSIVINNNQQNNESQNTPQNNTVENEGFAENSHYEEAEKKQIDEIIKNAQEYAGSPYKYGGSTKEGIDCSGLRSKALDKEYKEVGKGFNDLTAALFDNKAPDIARGDVERGDRMFWEDPNGVKGNQNAKGEKIYHIEMTLGKPFEKDGKRYVKTYGSSSDANIIDTGKNGVGYRIREIKDNHHFAKPPYYAKIVVMKQNDQVSNAA